MKSETNIEIQNFPEIEKWYLSIKKETFAIIHGTSMLPLLCEQDKVKVHVIDPSCLNVGDIIVFHASNTFIAHRLIGKITFFGTVFFLEKGDSGLLPSLLSESEIIGKVCSLISQDGQERDLTNEHIAYPRLLKRLVYFFLLKTKTFFLALKLYKKVTRLIKRCGISKLF